MATGSQSQDVMTERILGRPGCRSTLRMNWFTDPFLMVIFDQKSEEWLESIYIPEFLLALEVFELNSHSRNNNDVVKRFRMAVTVLGCTGMRVINDTTFVTFPPGWTSYKYNRIMGPDTSARMEWFGSYMGISIESIYQYCQLIVKNAPAYAIADILESVFNLMFKSETHSSIITVSAFMEFINIVGSRGIDVDWVKIFHRLIINLKPVEDKQWHHSRAMECLTTFVTVLGEESEVYDRVRAQCPCELDESYEECGDHEYELKLFNIATGYEQ